MKILVLGLILAVAAGAQAAQTLYRWVNENGQVEWRDTPPPIGAKDVEKRDVRGSTIETSTPSYSTQQAVKNFPVTLWAYDCGDPCADARKHLARRGVPYSEKDPRADLTAFEKLTGSTNVPVLYVGSTKLAGYLESSWDTALDTAGYPRSAAPGAKPPVTPAPKLPVAQKSPPAGAPAEKAGEAPAQPSAAPPPPAGK